MPYAAICRFKRVTVGAPVLTDENGVTFSMNPQQCRLRDLTYAAPIRVDIDYTKSRSLVSKAGRNAVDIGRLPLMLRSDRQGTVISCASFSSLVEGTW